MAQKWWKLTFLANFFLYWNSIVMIGQFGFYLQVYMFRDEIMSKKEERAFFLVAHFPTFFCHMSKYHIFWRFLDCTLLRNFEWHFNLKLSSWGSFIKKIGGSLGHSTPLFFISQRSSTLDYHFLSHYSYIKAIKLYKAITGPICWLNVYLMGITGHHCKIV